VSAGRRDLRNLSQSFFLRQRLILTNRIWIDTSNGGMRSNNINRSTQISDLLQKRHLPPSLLHNPIPLSSGEDTSSEPRHYDAGLISCLEFVCHSFGRHFVMHFLFAFLVCCLDSLYFLASFNPQLMADTTGKRSTKVFIR